MEYSVLVTEYFGLSSVNKKIEPKIFKYL